MNVRVKRERESETDSECTGEEMWGVWWCVVGKGGVMSLEMFVKNKLNQS